MPQPGLLVGWYGALDNQIVMTGEHKIKIGAAHKGRVKTNEQKRKISETLKSKGIKPPSRKGIPNPYKGISKVEQFGEERAKALSMIHSVKMKGRRVSPKTEFKKKIIDSDIDATKICEHCGIVFNRTPGMGHERWKSRKFCSFICTSEYRKGKKRFPMRKDVKGRRFGRWLVIEFSHVDHRNRAMWECKCDCGKESVVAGSALLAGTSKSCGCLKLDNLRISKSLPKGEATLNKIFRDYSNNYPDDFVLTKGQFKNLVIQNCFYCGAAPKEVPISKSFQGVTNGTISANGLDRLDNTRGHEYDNCVPCCYKCNRMKSALQVDDWIKQMGRIIEFNGYGKMGLSNFLQD